MKRYGLILALLAFIGAVNGDRPSVVYSDPPKTVESIETYRKGDVILRFTDENGSVPNCAVTFAQDSHDFLFAANPMGKFNQYDSRYANFLKEAGINFSYILTTWGSIEPEPGHFEWGAIDSYQDIEAQLTHGFKLMSGLALWWYRGSGLEDQFCPLYLDNMDFNELKTITYNHMYELATQYKGIIDIWEFNEPNSSWTNPLDLTWKQKLEIYQAATSGIRDAQPEAKILYDSNALPDEFGWPSSVDIDDKANGVQFPAFLNMLTDYGISFDIIGLELYYSGKNADGYIPPTLNIDELSDLIDLYASFGKPIFIRELSAPSEQVEGTSMWNGRPWNEETQADYLRHVYTMAFGKELVNAIGWSYGISDEDSYIIAGGILDGDLNPKSSYSALKDLIESWTTSGNCVTDKNGECTLRGFAGEYTITATAQDGRRLDTQIHILEGQEVEYNLMFVQEDTDNSNGGSGGGSGGGCFIATATYDSYLDPHVQVVKTFRDDYLLPNPIGRVFVGLYYRTSPPIANIINEHRALKAATRLILTPVVYGIKYPLSASYSFKPYGLEE